MILVLPIIFTLPLNIVFPSNVLFPIWVVEPLIKNEPVTVVAESLNVVVPSIVVLPITETLPLSLVNPSNVLSPIWTVEPLTAKEPVTVVSPCLNAEPMWLKLPLRYSNEPVGATNDAPGCTNNIPPTDISKFPSLFEIIADGSPGVSDSIDIEPDCRNISENGFSKVPNVAPCAINGMRFPPNSVIPVIWTEPVNSCLSSDEFPKIVEPLSYKTEDDTMVSVPFTVISPLIIVSPLIVVSPNVAGNPAFVIEPNVVLLEVPLDANAIKSLTCGFTSICNSDILLFPISILVKFHTHSHLPVR